MSTRLSSPGIFAYGLPYADFKITCAVILRDRLVDMRGNRQCHSTEDYRVSDDVAASALCLQRELNLENQLLLSKPRVWCEEHETL